MDSRWKTIMMKAEDKVAVALEKIEKGARVEVDGHGKILEIELKDDIDFGHKFAVVDIPEGEEIIKYGEVIGKAVGNIARGEHVHVHNLEGTRGRGDKAVDKQSV